MKTRAFALIMVAALVGLIPAAASAQIMEFTQDLESLNMADPDAMGNAGWVVYGNVYDSGGTHLYGYGVFPAPNNPAAPAFCNIVTGQGGTEQGAQQLSVFSDYENGDHANGHTLEANVFREFTVGASDVGKTWTFAFQGKMGDLVAPSTATAFIKTLDPGAGYATTNHVTQDMTTAPVEWGGWELNLIITADLVGQLFQVGFANTAANYDPSGIYYDNITLSDNGAPGGDGMLPYSQDFESLTAADTAALGDDGWLVYGNVFDPAENWLYGYGPNPAPNNPAAPAFCTIVVGEGGAEQGAQQLSVFSDYENGDHAAGNLIESNVYREQVIGNDDVGKTWMFEFQAKMPATGGVAAPATADAYIKTLDPANSYTMTNFVTASMNGIGSEWDGFTLMLEIDAGLVGQLFQVGFTNTSTLYQPTAIIYDNVVLSEFDPSDAPSPVPSAKLRQNYPNPFNPVTKISFSLETADHVELAIYDVVGRQVTTVVSEGMAAGDHTVTWRGLDGNGSPVASGVYHYVLKTDEGALSRSMVLLK